MSRLRLALRAGLVTAAALVAAVTLVTYAAALGITTAAITFPQVTLDGTVKTVTCTSAWSANATGQSGGWNVTVASTNFSNADNKTIAVANFEVRLLDENIQWVSGDAVNLPASTQTTFASLSGTPIKIASAAEGKGNGVYNMTPDFRLTVPAETYTGSYTATVTVAISTGP